MTTAVTGCTGGGRQRTAKPVDPAPGASRAELAHVPSQFPIRMIEARDLDASVTEKDGKQTIELRSSSPATADTTGAAPPAAPAAPAPPAPPVTSSPQAESLSLADHLRALGWEVSDEPTRAGQPAAFTFRGFGWRGRARFEEGGKRMIEMTQTGR